MDTSKLSQLIKDFSIEQIEKHIVYRYLIDNKVNATDSTFVSQYLEGFLPDDKLSKGVECIGISSIEEMASAMELLIPSEDKKSMVHFSLRLILPTTSFRQLRQLMMQKL